METTKRRNAAGQSQRRRKVTLDQYMTMVSRSVRKHEFVNGEIRPSIYASENHCLLTANLIGLLGTSLRITACRVYPNDRMLYVPQMDNYFYPDVMVVCGDSQFHTYKGKMQATTNPTVLVEVLSVTSKDYDEFTKWHNYRQIDSLQQYVCVAQDECRIDLYTRVGNSNEWLNTFVNQLDQTLTINGCVLTVREVYEHVSLP